MQLSSFGRDFYDLEITTDPALADVEASFDDGQTWHLGEAADGGFRWLLAGPNFDDIPVEGQINFDRPTVVPLIRITRQPQSSVRTAPEVTLI